MKNLVSLIFLSLYLLNDLYAFTFRRSANYFSNMRINQSLSQRNRSTSSFISKRKYHQPILHGRYYLEKILSGIYGRNGRLFQKIMHKMKFFGDGCDPLERTNRDLDYTFRAGCIDNKTIPDIRKESSIVREGWRLAACKELNANFHITRKPLKTIRQMFSNIEVNEDSIQFAYHLFNPYLKVPQEAMLSLVSFMTSPPEDPSLRLHYRKLRGDLDRDMARLNRLEERLHGSRVSNFQKRRTLAEIENIKNSDSYDLLTTQKMSEKDIWEFIFYTFCVDPNNQII